jgi:hypothetical protein
VPLPAAQQHLCAPALKNATEWPIFLLWNYAQNPQEQGCSGRKKVIHGEYNEK